MGLRVAVVGAGAAGLAALKELSEAGFDVTCFELGERVGGIWAYGNRSGLSPAYRTLHLNTSKARTEFEDHPMPEDYPDFADHERIQAWFESYVDRFGLRGLIRFECGVERAGRLPGGGWELELADGSRERFDVLVAANGHNWDPRWPDPPYPGTFDGAQMHAHDFRDNERFEGRRVLVVGFGNSAMDIAVESSWVAERTFLSTRKGAWVVPKTLFGKPADQITKPAMTRLPWQIRQPLSHLLLRVGVGHPSRYGLPAPSRGLLQDHPTISDTVLHRITHGEITPKAGIERFDGDAVVFTDGSRERVDEIVWCTGYRVALPFLDERLVGADGAELPLYMRMFHPAVDDIFFIGLIQSTGSAIPICEQQAKLLTEYLTGRYALPLPEERQRVVERNRRRAERRYGAAKRPYMRVDFDGYMREIRRERRRGAKRASRGALGQTGARLGEREARRGAPAGVGES